MIAEEGKAILIRDVAGKILALLLLLGAAGCSHLPNRPNVASMYALPPGNSTKLDEIVSLAEAAHPSESGFHLVTDGAEAFATRALSARAAGRSIDVQYYIWDDDLAGLMLGNELIKAADRGVRVRMLIDDLNGRKKNNGLAALQAHPLIDVRLFNPVASREGNLRLGMEMIGDFSRLNHRMHNKAWIVDNRLAIAGGRNIGSAYFGASKGVNFQDVDLTVVGPAVRALSDSFDRYWNSAEVWPIAALSPEGVNQTALASLSKAMDDYAVTANHSPWIEALAKSNAVASIRNDTVTMHWTSKWQLLSDDPAKMLADGGVLAHSAVLAGLLGRFSEAKSQVDIISPYFIPREDGTQVLIGIAQSGREVNVLTNSLASNDVVSAQGRYANYRPALLKGGVHLWELKPDEGEKSKSSLLGSSGASLHGKAAIIDDATAFVGSFNLDPRSVNLNSEQGLLVTESVIAKELKQFFVEMTSPAHAWRVKRKADGQLVWSDGKQSFDNDPEATMGKRFMAWMAGWLPVEPLL